MYRGLSTPAGDESNRELPDGKQGNHFRKQGILLIRELAPALLTVGPHAGRGETSPHHKGRARHPYIRSHDRLIGLRLWRQRSLPAQLLGRVHRFSAP